jgi:hypothetical protein
MAQETTKDRRYMVKVLPFGRAFTTLYHYKWCCPELDSYKSYKDIGTENLAKQKWMHITVKGYYSKLNKFNTQQEAVEAYYNSLYQKRRSLHRNTREGIRKRRQEIRDFIRSSREEFFIMTGKLKEMEGGFEFELRREIQSDDGSV